MFPAANKDQMADSSLEYQSKSTDTLARQGSLELRTAPAAGALEESGRFGGRQLPSWDVRQSVKAPVVRKIDGFRGRWAWTPASGSLRWQTK